MRKGDIYLGTSGHEILLTPFGRTSTIEIIELSRQERTSSGRLVKDITAIKHKFTIKYSLIDESELNKILALYNVLDALSLIYFTETGTYTVLMDPFDRSNVLLSNEGLYSGVSFVLNEV